MRYLLACLYIFAYISLVHGLQHSSDVSFAYRGLKKLGVPKGVASEKQGPIAGVDGTLLPPLDTVYLFNQLIDHTDPTKGTFQQRYWSTWEFYKPGGPIILTTLGEVAADGYASTYLTNSSLNGMIAQQENGATVLIEHRFFGQSNPYNDLTATSLQFLTIQQAIDDLVYFAENVKLPMPGGNAVSPMQAPWILIGGSYAGALTAWTKVNSPDTFWAAYASSAVVEAIADFWAYFQPVLENMPANCSADAQAVIALVDQVWTGSNQTAINALKHVFGLDLVPNLDDCAGALRYPFYLWQNLQPYSTADQSFYRFCDALEVNGGVSAPAAGWGLDHALAAWGNYTIGLCPSSRAAACWDTYNSASGTYTNVATGNADRSWHWILCNELGFYLESAPVGKPSLISRLLTPTYGERLCTYYFPDKFPSAMTPVPKVDATNTKYGGWTVNEPRLFFANGRRDPWREATVSAENLTIPSTSLQPIAVSDGFHCSDLLAAYAQDDNTVSAVQSQALASMRTWLAAWTPPV